MFRLDRKTVYNTIDRWQQHQTLQSRPRSGRTRKSTSSDDQYIKLSVRLNPRISLKDLMHHTRLNIGATTFRRRLQATGLVYRPAAKKIPLNQADVQSRQRFQRWWLPRVEELTDGIFSDECSIQNHPSNPTAYVWRMPSEKYRRDLVNLKTHVKPTISIMLWGAIWKGGRSPLIVMERDQQSKRKGYSAKSYIKALEEGLLPIYDGTRHFQQDNAPIHKSRPVVDFMDYHAISLIEWPSHSPDLNPIENVWHMLKMAVTKQYPDMGKLLKNEADISKFKEVVQKAWDDLDQEAIDRVIDSMPRRLRTLRKARGWYTKY